MNRSHDGDLGPALAFLLAVLLCVAMEKIAVRRWGDSPNLEVHDEPRDAVMVVDGAPWLDDRYPEHSDCSRQEMGERVEIQWQTDNAAGVVSARCLTSEVIEVKCQLNVTRRWSPRHIGWRVALKAHECRVLSDQYRLAPVCDAARANRLTPAAMIGQCADRWVGLVGTDLLAGHEWQQVDHNVSCTLWLDQALDHPRFTFEGPQFRNWHDEYSFDAGFRLTARLYVIVSSEPVSLMVPGRYPQHYRAAFAITDHADHDSCSRLAALWYGRSSAPKKKSAGFVGLDLPFTKSVFTATPEADGPGLHNTDFTELCRRGAAAGIEICPHGVHSSVQPSVSEIGGLLAPFHEFQPRTWIDHGNRFMSNYGRRGWDPHDEYSLHPWLDQLDIRYVWGRMDFGQSLPRGQLDQLAVGQFRGLSYIKDWPSVSWRGLRGGRPWVPLHALAGLAFQVMPERKMLQYFLTQRQIQRVMRGDLRALPEAVAGSLKIAAGVLLPPGIHDLARHLTGVRRELSHAPIFFREHYSVQTGGDRWLFNTVAVHDVEYAYSPPVLADLMECYGIHLSHTYLGSVSPAHVSHAIEKDGADDWRLTDRFDKNLKHLAELREESRLWVASMQEMGEFWSRRHAVRLHPSAKDQWKLEFESHDTAEPMDVQIVVVGNERQVHHAGGVLATQPLRSDVRFGPLSIRVGQPRTLTLE